MRLCRAEKAETRGSDGKIAIPCFRTSAKTAGIHHIWWIPAVFLHFLPKVQTQPRNTTYYAYLGAYNFFMSRIGNGGRRPVPPCAPWARSRTGAGHTARWRRVPACGGTGLWTAACSPARCVRAARLRSAWAGALKLRRSVQVRPTLRRSGGMLPAVPCAYPLRRRGGSMGGNTFPGAVCACGTPPLGMCGVV